MEVAFLRVGEAESVAFVTVLFDTAQTNLTVEEVTALISTDSFAADMGSMVGSAVGIVCCTFELRILAAPSPPAAAPKLPTTPSDGLVRSPNTVWGMAFWLLVVIIVLGVFALCCLAVLISWLSVLLYRRRRHSRGALAERQAAVDRSRSGSDKPPRCGASDADPFHQPSRQVAPSRASGARSAGPIVPPEPRPAAATSPPPAAEAAAMPLPTAPAPRPPDGMPPQPQEQIRAPAVVPLPTAALEQVQLGGLEVPGPGDAVLDRAMEKLDVFCTTSGWETTKRNLRRAVESHALRDSDMSLEAGQLFHVLSSPVVGLASFSVEEAEAVVRALDAEGTGRINLVHLEESVHAFKLREAARRDAAARRSPRTTQSPRLSPRASHALQREVSSGRNSGRNQSTDPARSVKPSPRRGRAIVWDSSLLAPANAGGASPGPGASATESCRELVRTPGTAPAVAGDSPYRWSRPQETLPMLREPPPAVRARMGSPFGRHDTSLFRMSAADSSEGTPARPPARQSNGGSPLAWQLFPI